jgi:hypothetical protein
MQCSVTLAKGELLYAAFFTLLCLFGVIMIDAQ